MGKEKLKKKEHPYNNWARTRMEKRYISCSKSNIFISQQEPKEPDVSILRCQRYANRFCNRLNHREALLLSHDPMKWIVNELCPVATRQSIKFPASFLEMSCSMIQFQKSFLIYVAYIHSETKVHVGCTGAQKAPSSGLHEADPDHVSIISMSMPRDIFQNIYKGGAAVLNEASW